MANDLLEPIRAKSHLRKALCFFGNERRNS